MIALEILLVSAVGGAVALDKAAVFQFMVSRPIVAAPLIGLMLGDVSTGLQAGVVLELLWIGCLPVGASVPPDETLLSILVTAVTVWCSKALGVPPEEVMALCLVLLLPVAIFSQRMDSYVRRMNIASAHEADLAGEKLDLKRVERECLKGMARFYVGYSSMLFLFLLMGTAVVYSLYPLLPGWVRMGLLRFYYVLPLIGIASLMSMIRVRHALTLAGISFFVFTGFFEVFGW